ncbi:MULTISPECIES: ParB/RepB/Spo0J family partition protein [Streptomycetaceae]|uniref:Transcriptional regulator protein n=1 Tax=Streptantibioticus cattleyicolor (strain ATCC 35852 / DSM 46488 / JCM 4925 / NBRC 14057 / NRRL 8057) TaxID=1003195 RepID=F8JU13_STREN|nr:MULTISPECIES: ParB N-terminal domain-containing protein [Streptomycetaceae]AEW98168.1 transcriptional regulator protein [Streptantibioticus cattleyicolor NRRL 8057 = DSM 46488]MYS62553.1 ParB N-terminal domain-containing protein [Streptomyces sp. SID5468]CCB78484.1 putative Streptomycin biosynthesis operon regulatory protein [Streptantibioticus cattleyicolor NRRL 8057 = DSM 46488]
MAVVSVPTAQQDMAGQASLVAGEGAGGLSEPQLVPLGLLLPADSPRRSADNADHARSLAESENGFPPITVHRPSMRVIDGMYRVRAAELRGQAHIEVRFFDGSPEDAFVLAVRSNIGHGLPLSLAERKAAAARIVLSHAHWSDRAIAAVTGLAAKTVASLRRSAARGTEQPQARIGRDGRRRPLDSAEGRRRAVELITRSPQASLREVAKAAGISPGTVRDVRRRLASGLDPIPAQRRAAARPAPAAPPRGAQPAAVRSGGQVRARITAARTHPSLARPAAAGAAGRVLGPAALRGGADRDREAMFKALCRDPSLRHSETGRLLLRMLEMHAMAPQQWQAVTDAVPAHCADLVRALAAECARSWQEFATVVARGRCA